MLDKFWWGGRCAIYVIGFPVAALVDMKTPLGVADWLFEVLLVWIAASREMIVVALAGTAIMWHSVELYITEHSEALFTHTYCPECLRTYFPEMTDSAGEGG